MNVRFPRTARVRARAEFDRIFRDGRRVAAPCLALHWLAHDQAARLGLAVSRKVSPHAVVRNRIKRVLRDEFRGLRGGLPNGDYVLVARAGAADLAAPALRLAFCSLLRRAAALPPRAADGTMPPASLSPHCAPDSSGR
ncbi:MAG: ribonuclease P protein component [Luteimonas sp.]